MTFHLIIIQIQENHCWDSVDISLLQFYCKFLKNQKMNKGCKV